MAGQSPEAVEFKGVKNLVEAVKANLLTESAVRVFDAAVQASCCTLEEHHAELRALIYLEL